MASRRTSSRSSSFKIDDARNDAGAPIRIDFDEESEAQRPDVRLFAFFLDDYHVRRGASMHSRIRWPTSFARRSRRRTWSA